MKLFTASNWDGRVLEWIVTEVKNGCHYLEGNKLFNTMLIGESVFRTREEAVDKAVKEVELSIAHNKAELNRLNGVLVKLKEG